MNLQGVLGKLGRGTGGRLLILNYDRLGASPTPPGAEPDQGFDADEFSWQMEQVAARFEPILLSRLLGHLGGKRPLAGPQVCISWHATSRSDYRFALGAMRRLNLPATCYLALEGLHGDASHDPADPAASLGWNDLREIAASGGDIALHLRSGSDLVGLNSAQRRQELARLRGRAEQESGIRVRAFVYSGGAGEEPDKSLIYDAALAGYSLGANGHSGINSLRPFAPMLLKRQAVTPNMTRDRFLSLLDSLARGK
jgi:peptidoglycan/xylan/chitin deacetylase (PgdA/CDA1 family)